MICLTLSAVALAYMPATAQLSRFARWLSPLVLALATLTKILPILLSPVFFWRWNWPQRVIFALTLMLVLLPPGLRAGWGISGELDGHGLFAALRIYGNQWNYNSGLFHWLEIGLHEYGGLDPDVALQWAKRTIGLVMFLVLVWTWWRGRTVERSRTALRLMTVPLMGYVVLTPTFHPWYLLLLLAFVPYLTPTADEEQAVRWPVLGWLWPAPWLYLSGALSLSYLTYRDPLDLREFEWVRQSEWIPTLFLLLLAIGYSVWRKVDRPSYSTNG